MHHKTAVIRAIEDAKRFIARAEQYLLSKPFGHKGEVDMWGGPEAAAMKRASLDVMRSTADLRQGRP